MSKLRQNPRNNTSSDYQMKRHAITVDTSEDDSITLELSSMEEEVPTKGKTAINPPLTLELLKHLILSTFHNVRYSSPMPAECLMLGGEEGISTFEDLEDHATLTAQIIREKCSVDQSQGYTKWGRPSIEGREIITLEEYLFRPFFLFNTSGMANLRIKLIESYFNLYVSHSHSHSFIHSFTL